MECACRSRRPSHRSSKRQRRASPWRCDRRTSSTPFLWSPSGGWRRAAHRFEALDPPSVQRLRNIEIAFRIYGDTVRAGDPPQLVAARATELREFLSRDSIEDPNEFVAEIANVHVPLRSV